MLQEKEIIWTVREKCIFRFGFVFILLFLFTCPFPYHMLPDTGRLCEPFFEWLVKWSGKYLLGMEQPFKPGIISDATGMYIHLLNVFIIATIIAIIWGFVDRGRNHYRRLESVFLNFISYYLSLQMLIYGFDKIFKGQFYLPEPNTLFTTIGNTHKDLLYWSTMGLSRSYVIFMGLLEVMGAILLLFPRTRAVAALGVAGIMLNVVMVNFGFDISVKCFSLFLLLLSLLIAIPAIKLLFRFFIKQQSISPVIRTKEKRSRKQFWCYATIKSLVIFMLFYESLFVYAKSGNFNDDKAPRPPLHGAWTVFRFLRNGDSLAKHDIPWKRVFVHRFGYFIIQNEQGNMLDYKLHTDEEEHKLTILNYQTNVTFTFRYRNEHKDTLSLKGVWGKDTIEVFTQKIPLDSLPAMQHGFHWTMDDQ